MKNKILLTLLLLSTSLTGFSTVWTVNSVGNTFSPANTTVTVGDTINFVIANMHDVIEVSQTTWNANDNSPLPGGFSTPYGGGMVYSASLAVGTHYYVCEPHASAGMKGKIIVQPCTPPAAPTAISGDAAVCASSSNMYSVTAVSGATAYTWTLPSGWSGTSTTNSISTIASNTGGTITVSANNSCGTSADEMLTVTVNTVDTSVTQPNDSTLIANDSGATYQWINCINNEAIVGQTNQTFQATANGNYAVIVTENGCSDTSSCHNLEFTGVGITENNPAAFTLIYPNPSNGKFQITGDAFRLNKNYNIKIYNIIGKTIYQSVITGPKSDIDLSNQAKGIYFIRIQDGQRIYTNKIIIK